MALSSSSEQELDEMELLWQEWLVTDEDETSDIDSGPDDDDDDDAEAVLAGEVVADVVVAAAAAATEPLAMGCCCLPGVEQRLALLLLPPCTSSSSIPLGSVRLSWCCWQWGMRRLLDTTCREGSCLVCCRF